MIEYKANIKNIILTENYRILLPSTCIIHEMDNTNNMIVMVSCIFVIH